MTQLPVDIYHELWAGLDELEWQYGKSARVQAAREWLRRELLRRRDADAPVMPDQVAIDNKTASA